MLLPNRHGSSNEYRYGFQGQEKDDEIKGEGNSVNYKYRMHDPRVGRFFAVDPLAREYSYNSPYAFSENIVMNAVELEGLEAEIIQPAGGVYLIKLKNVDFNFVVRKSDEYLTDALENATVSGRQNFGLNSQMFDRNTSKADYYSSIRPQDNSKYESQGFNIQNGENVHGRRSSQTFYFAQAEEGCGWSCGNGGVPSDSFLGFGGGTPLIVDGLKYGVTNVYKSNAPDAIKQIGQIGQIPSESLDYLHQKSNGVYAGQNTMDVGKTILGYNSKDNTWILISQENGSNGFTLDEIRDALASMGYDNALGFDGSNSSVLLIDGDKKVDNATYKDSTTPSGLNISVPETEEE